MNDETRTFVSNNPFRPNASLQPGPGNPNLRRMHLYRQAAQAAVSEQELTELFRDMYKLARGQFEAPMVDPEGRPVLDPSTDEQRMGTLPPQAWAAKELLDRIMGKAPQGIYQSDETGEPIEKRDIRMAITVLVQEGLVDKIPPQLREIIDQPESESP